MCSSGGEIGSTGRAYIIANVCRFYIQGVWLGIGSKILHFHDKELLNTMKDKANRYDFSILECRP